MDTPTTVPRLTTALSGPLPELERAILQATPTIEHWLRSQWQEHEAPFYCSVDLRNSGFKIAPVDTNLFPGGVNHLNPEFQPLCVQAAMTALEKICPDARGAHERKLLQLLRGPVQIGFRGGLIMWLQENQSGPGIFVTLRRN